MKMAVLGPQGTFSESALKKYEEIRGHTFEKEFYNSITATFFAIGENCDIGIVPVENTLDGYVQRSLDMLLEQDLHIIDEVIIPIKFSLISNVKEKLDIKKVFVQFKANGQCLKFLNSLSDVQIVTTQSNTESYELFLANSENSCAIIPNHMFVENGYFAIEDVTDSINNYTRFFVVKKDSSDTLISKNIKVSLFILSSEDKPGLLYSILEKFYRNKINLCSIISRPTKKNLGTYNFYIELSGTFEEKDIIKNTLKELNLEYSLKIIGIYNE